VVRSLLGDDGRWRGVLSDPLSFPIHSPTGTISPTPVVTTTTTLTRRAAISTLIPRRLSTAALRTNQTRSKFSSKFLFPRGPPRIPACCTAQQR
jgi:hypothetical protein